jgi:hypothetical protein
VGPAGVGSRCHALQIVAWAAGRVVPFVLRTQFVESDAADRRRVRREPRGGHRAPRGRRKAAKDRNGLTALEHAMKGGQKPCALALLAAPDALKSAAGPVLLAVKSRKQALVKLLYYTGNKAERCRRGRCLFFIDRKLHCICSRRVGFWSTKNKHRTLSEAILNPSFHATSPSRMRSTVRGRFLQRNTGGIAWEERNRI